MILVHICCSVDSHYFLQKLRENYIDSTIIGYFYNPNIHPRAEYDLRLADVERSCKILDIELFEGEYELNHWFSGVSGLENEPEKGKRCEKCFDIRLLKTAEFAKSKNITRFTTTLLSSPMKEQQILFAQGDKIAKDYNLEFIKLDVRSNGGTQAQAELANKDRLYKQNYCGCEFALIKQRESKGNVPLELLDNIGGQIQQGSNEWRREIFAKRDWCEKNNKDYVLFKQSIILWRNLRAFCILNDVVIDSYIITHSKSKNNIKSGSIVWAVCDFDMPNNEQVALKVGYAKRDDSVFLPLDSLNALLNLAYKNVRELIYNPPTYKQECFVREIISGAYSTNPIIVLDSAFVESSLKDTEQPPLNIKIFINALFQEDSIFNIAIKS